MQNYMRTCAPKNNGLGVYHSLGPLNAPAESPPKFAQLFMYDPGDPNYAAPTELDLRMGLPQADRMDRGLLQVLMAGMQQHKSLVQLFMVAGRADTLKTGDPKNGPAKYRT